MKKDLTLEDLTRVTIAAAKKLVSEGYNTPEKLDALLKESMDGNKEGGKENINELFGGLIKTTDEKIKKAQEAVDSNDEQKLTDAIFYNFEIPSIPNVKRSAIENAIKNLPIESKIKFLNSGIDHKFEGTLKPKPGGGIGYFPGNKISAGAGHKFGGVNA